MTCECQVLVLISPFVNFREKVQIPRPLTPRLEQNQCQKLKETRNFKFSFNSCKILDHSEAIFNINLLYHLSRNLMRTLIINKLNHIILLERASKKCNNAIQSHDFVTILNVLQHFHERCFILEAADNSSRCN